MVWIETKINIGWTLKPKDLQDLNTEDTNIKSRRQSLRFFLSVWSILKIVQWNLSKVATIETKDFVSYKGASLTQGSYKPHPLSVH